MYISPARLGALLSLMAAMVAAPRGAESQARGTAEQQVRLQVFAMPTYVRPNYGRTVTNFGASVGGDANFNTRWQPVQISAEFRALGSGGDVVNEYVYSVGPRLLLDLGRIQPYGDFLFGYGSIHFNQSTNSYKQDNSAVYSYGGGVDVRVSDSWGVRADVQRQQWQISHNQPVFHPTQGAVGLRYQFHFRSRNGPF